MIYILSPKTLDYSFGDEEHLSITVSLWFKNRIITINTMTLIYLII